MPPPRDDPAKDPATGPPETYASIWFELSEAQRSAILAAIGGTDPGTPTAEPTPAVRETMHALRRVLLDETIVHRQSGRGGGRQSARQRESDAPGWGWRPQDNGLVGASFDPGHIVGGSAPERGALICQQVAVPADTPVRSVLLEVVTPGIDLTPGSANLAAVYEADGTRAGVSTAQSRSWSSVGLQRANLAQYIPRQVEARNVWVAFIAHGGSLPGFAVPWISRAARPNLGLPTPGPQRAGKITGQTTCPEAIIPIEMQADAQYWVGLA